MFLFAYKYSKDGNYHSRKKENIQKFGLLTP